MIIAQHKKKETIVEYVLYLWHIEDLIRANTFDMRNIRNNIIDRFDLPEASLQKMEEWYQNLMQQMEREEIQKSGHLSHLTEWVHQLNDFHLNLLNDLNAPEYTEAYHAAQPYISELKRKSKPDATEIEVCLNALYMLMTMRMKQTPVSPETTAAIETFGRLLSLLNQRYMTRK